VLFGFILPEYRPREGTDIVRLPTPRASIYFAVDVENHLTGERLGTGLFCEGPHAKGFHVTYGCKEMVALKVRGGGLRNILGVPARELRDSTEPLQEIWGRSASELADTLVEAKSAAERFRLLQDALVGRARKRPRDGRLARAAVESIEAHRGSVQVTQVSDALGCSRRSLVNAFDEWVGLTPKQYARLVRLRVAVARSLDRDRPDWASIAAECGYFDQAHLIHEFHALVGCSPSALVPSLGASAPRARPALGQGAVPPAERRLYRSLGLVSKWLSEPRPGRLQPEPAKAV
jgi:AraC-like DNA-binding protein